jgi:uncharacterized membrane protein HdeD (DUF308 family)
MSTETERTFGPAEVDVAPLSPAVERRHELHHLRASWWWLFLLGVLLTVCGTIAIIFPVLTSVAAITVLAVVLMVGGVATIVGAFWAGKWSGVLVQLLVGILYVVAGFVVSERTLPSLVMLTLFLAVSFIVMGMFRALAALMIRFPQWGWALLNGVITLLAGVVIYRQLPLDALWVIGLLVGLEMLFNGWTWIMLACALHRLPEEAGL